MAKPKPQPTAPQRPASREAELPERKEWYLVRAPGTAGLVAVVEVPMVPDVARAKVVHPGGSLAAARVRAATLQLNYADATFKERQAPVGEWKR